ncbi:uncharacterized protein LOC122796353 [Protopterus annectens]|uniref:uncharacterized protein LOC122796353 n=1 Tax=Protopterus annectens TaxID=7888 RepID=UPI001CF9B623|nr:uncharacterized protein LOC122796353 [Protopterus annectens]
MAETISQQVKLEVPESFEDVAIDFSKEEWKLLSKEDKQLHREVMVQNYEHMVAVGYTIPIEHLSRLFDKPDEPPPKVRKDDAPVNRSEVTVTVNGDPVEKKRRLSSFQLVWKILFDWVMESRLGTGFAFCKVCNTNISIGHGGRHDLQRHSKTEKHKGNQKHASERKETEMSDPLAPQSGSSQEVAESQVSQHSSSARKVVESEVTKHSSSAQRVVEAEVTRHPNSAQRVVEAEVAFVSLLEEHNLPSSTADHLLKYIKKYCTDPEVVRKMSCGATKAACIARDVLGPKYKEDVASICRKQPYCIYLGQNTDMEDSKLLMILAGFFDQTKGQNVVKFLDLPVCVTRTGDLVYNCLMETLQKFNIPTSNMVAYSSNNTEVTSGKCNSVLSRLMDMNPDLFSMCHLYNVADLCIKSGVKATALPIKDLISDIYFHLSSGPQKQQKLKEFDLFGDLEPLTVIGHGPTHWASLSKVIKRILDLWPDLLSYFVSYESRSKKVDPITEKLKSHDTKLALLFLQYAMEPLLKFIVKLQARDSQLINLHNDIIKLLQVYASRSLKPLVAREFIQNISASSNSVLENDSDILPYGRIHVGPDVAMYLDENAKDIDEVIEHTFYNKVKAFYIAVLKKMKKILPVSDSVIQNIGNLLNPSFKLQLTSTVVTNIAKRLGFCKSRTEWSQLMDEFAMYQINEFECSHQQDETETDAFFLKYWSAVLQSAVVKEMTVFKKLLLTVLCLPHSNSALEKAFNTVHKVKTEMRQSLNTKMLNSLLAIKLNEDNDCFVVEHPESILHAARKATAAYNKVHP